jgi:predicted transcriptional regulator
MSTTTVRLDPALKARLAAVARRVGKTPHALILEAISQTVEQAEFDDELHRLAEERWAAFLKTGKAVSWDDAKEYLRALGRGERPKRPVARKILR